ncbi:MAG: DUF3365 domain-containing protein [Hyphomonadaceae bacterium]|nr:DUF3365 domain-containing protein [Hyphomonadaceae bacterium]
MMGHNKTGLTAIGAFLLLTSAAGAAAPLKAAPNAVDTAIAEKSAVLADQFQQRLQQALRAAIQEKGLPGAVDVCSTVAPTIAAEVSAASGVQVTRIAERNRNPKAHVPRDARAYYGELAEEPVESGKPATRMWHSGGGQSAKVNYLRAIPMLGQPCLSCHGADVDPAVAARIAKLYPKDKATGFRPGELRGAMLIRWNAASLTKPE